MKNVITRVALAALTLAAAQAACAKTLVYCSEGSPENFNPQLYTSGTSVDASAVPIYNRLVDFKVVPPSWCRAWRKAGISARMAPNTPFICVKG